MLRKGAFTGRENVRLGERFFVFFFYWNTSRAEDDSRDVETTTLESFFFSTRTLEQISERMGVSSFSEENQFFAFLFSMHKEGVKAGVERCEQQPYVAGSISAWRTAKQLEHGTRSSALCACKTLWSYSSSLAWMPPSNGDILVAFCDCAIISNVFRASFVWTSKNNRSPSKNTIAQAAWSASNRTDTRLYHRAKHCLHKKAPKEHSLDLLRLRAWIGVSHIYCIQLKCKHPYNHRSCPFTDDAYLRADIVTSDEAAYNWRKLTLNGANLCPK